MAVGLTWWGHATLLIEDRARLLTDPILTGSLVHLRRRRGIVPPVSTHKVDAVLISHLHIDHLHRPSLSLIEPGTPVLIPRGAAKLLAGLPLLPVEVVEGDVVPVGEATVRVVHAAHDATRWPFGRIRGEAIGYVVEGEATTYFAGDTEAFPGMADLAPQLDIALLPVGGWGPWLRGQHMDPDGAAECLPVLGPAVAVPMHYGTFWPRGISWLRPRVFHDPGREFAARAAVVAPEVDVRVLAAGASTSVLVAGSSAG